MSSKHYDKSTQELMMDYIKEINLSDGKVFKKRDMISWFHKKYPKIKDGTIYQHLIKLSVNAPSRKHHSVREKDNVLFQINADTFRLYDESKDNVIMNNDESNEDEVRYEEKSTTEFAYENHLRDYLEKNLTKIESGLKLYEDDGVKGIEYQIDVGKEKGFIDILAIDENDNFVVIELKRSEGSYNVVGQILFYKNWIKKELAEENQRVRGIIICNKITDKLRLACMGLEDVELIEYELSISCTKKNLS
jgi:RecB family endonuclease NucS